MYPTPFIPAPPLASAVVKIVGPEPTTCLVAASAPVAKALAKAGHTVTRWQISKTPDTGAPTSPEDLEPLPEASCASSLEALALVHEGTLLEPPRALWRYGVLVLSEVLTGLDDSRRVMSALVPRLPPMAWVVVVEPASYGHGGRWLGALVGRLRGRPLLADPSALASDCLAAGLTDLRQTWPQGLRSLVLTAGRVSPLCGLREPR